MSLAYDIAQKLGKFEKNGDGFVCCCPVHKEKKPSMSITDKGDNDVNVYCHVGCGFKEIKDELRSMGLLPEWKPNKSHSDTGKKTIKRSPSPATTPAKQEELEKQSYIWAKASREILSHIKEYFEGRSITLEKGIPDCFKWNSYKDKEGVEQNIIVCAASKPGDEDVFAVQRLFIDIKDHKKTGAKMHGPVDGRGVWFDRKGNLKSILIGEGIETVLSAMQATGYNGVAALSTSGIKNFIFPEETEEIFILVDSDPVRENEKSSMPGQKAAILCAERFEESKKGRVAYIVTPDDTCFTEAPNKLDFNDLLKRSPSGVEVKDRFEKSIRFYDIDWRPRQEKTEDKNNLDEWTQMRERFVFLASENKIIDTAGHDIKDSMMLERAFTVMQSGKFHYYQDAEGHDKVMPLSQAWMLSDEKQIASSLKYRPGEKLLFQMGDSRTYYNTFRFPYQTTTPLPAEELTARLFCWQLIIITVFHKHVSYIEDWFSYSLQHPESRSGIMPICISKVGLGKSLIMSIINKVIGSHNFSNAKILDVTGLGKSGTQWGDWIHNKKISCIEEINPEGENEIRYKVLDSLKDIITNETLNLNLKGGRNGTFQVYTNIMGFSNHNDCIKIPKDDRRLFVVDSTGQNLLTQKMYSEIWQWMRDDKNIVAVYQYLMSREISDEFVPGQAKMTKAKLTMQADGRSEMQEAFDLVIEQYPCDLVTTGELRLAVAQALNFVRGDNDDDDEPLEDIGNKNSQYNYIVKSVTTMVAEGKRIRIHRKKFGEGKPGLIRAIRNSQKWMNATNEEIKEYMNMEIPLVWIKEPENIQKNTNGMIPWNNQF